MGVITVLTDKKNKLTKTVLDKSLKTVAAGHIVDGTGKVVDVSLTGLKDLILGLEDRQCLSTGIVAEKGLEEYKIKSKSSARPGDITRTSSDFSMHDDKSFMLFDIDGHNATQVLDELCNIDLGLQKCGILSIPSVSSWLWDIDMGSWLSEGKSSHLYIEVSNGELIKGYGHELFRKLILKGFGKVHVVKTSGGKLLRTLVDEAVWSAPNREIFECNPVCCDGIVSKRLEKIEMEEGGVLDLVQSLERVRLTKEEEVEYREVVGKLKSDPEVVRQSGIERKKGLKIRAVRSGCSVGDLIKNYGRGFALGASESIMDNSGGVLPIKDILGDPMNYKDVGIPDPIDFYKRGDKSAGRVGQDIARIRWDEDTGRVYIFSFFGSIEYDLLWDFKSILNRLEEFSLQEDMEDWLDELFDIESGGTWTGYRLTTTELNEIAKRVAKLNKEFMSGPGNPLPSKYGTDGTSAKSALKSLNNGKKVAVSTEEEEVPDYINKINKKHGIGMYGGKAKIVMETYLPELGFWEPRFIDVLQLKTFYAEDRVVVMDSLGRGKEVDLFSAWEVNSFRNKYKSIVFRPSSDKFRGCGTVPVLQQGGEYNMWMGYLANLKNAKTCDKILTHIKDVWCDGDNEWYDWILKWFSELFQHPERIGQPFVVLKSLPGAGKNIIIDGVICKLLGIHAISTSNKKDIIGDFNHRLGMNVFCFLNEAFFAGDKSDRSAMKTMIDEHRTVTKKYADSEHAKNMTKVMIASNEENVTGAEVGDRRYCYLPVSDKKKGDTQYFKELKMEIEDGGREAFLDFILKHKSEIDLNNMPGSGNIQQKIDDILFGAETPVKFLYDLLKNGVTAEQQILVEEKVSQADAKALRFEWDKREIMIEKQSLLALYLDYCSKYGADSRFGRRDLQGLFKSFGSTGIHIYAANKVSSEQSEKYPMAVRQINKKRVLRVWQREAFLRHLEEVFLTH